MSDTISPMIHPSLRLMAHELEDELQHMVISIGLLAGVPTGASHDASLQQSKGQPGDPTSQSARDVEFPRLPRPASPVTEVFLTPQGANRVLVQWPAVTGARRYRIQTQIVGVDDDFVTEAMTIALEWPLQSLPSGAALRVRVSAVNEAGEAAPSPVATITVA